jgi:hypothetical protein
MTTSINTSTERNRAMTKIEHTNGHITFEGTENFEAISKAEAFLKKAGFSYGSMQRGAPIGFAYGDCLISKWRNLLSGDKDQLDGQISTDTSFRWGLVYVDLYDDASQEARAAFDKARGGKELAI